MPDQNIFPGNLDFEEAFKKLIDSLPEGVAILDVNNNILYGSSKVYTIFGYGPDENMNGKNVFEWVAPEEHGRLQNEIRKILKGGDPYTYILTVKRKDGSYMKAEFSSAPLKDSGNAQIGRIVIIRDISERLGDEEKIRRLNEELENRVNARTQDLQKAYKELEAFTYSISHDLRAPLRAIEGFSQILLDDYSGSLEGDGRGILNTLVDSTRRMTSMITDLLEFSKSGRKEIRETSIDLGGMLKGVYEELLGQNPGRDIRFTAGPMPAVRGDESLVRQAVMNLMSNAVKFTRYKLSAVIEAGCREINGESVFYISDNGAGYDSQYQHRLFGVFQRLHGSEQFEGTGVGLAIAQKIIQRHGGRIWSESEMGKGAVFYFTLPPAPRLPDAR